MDNSYNAHHLLVLEGLEAVRKRPGMYVGSTHPRGLLHCPRGRLGAPVLEGRGAVRKRPGVYVGSTDARGLMHCLWEIIDNAVDEALAGHGACIEATRHAEGGAAGH